MHILGLGGAWRYAFLSLNSSSLRSLNGLLHVSGGLRNIAEFWIFSTRFAKVPPHEFQTTEQ